MDTPTQAWGKKRWMSEYEMQNDLWYRTMASVDNVMLAKRFGSRQSGS